jgi:hypothetical protein
VAGLWMHRQQYARCSRSYNPAAEALRGKLQMLVPPGGGTLVIVPVPVTEQPVPTMEANPNQ